MSVLRPLKSTAEEGYFLLNIENIEIKKMPEWTTVIKE